MATKYRALTGSINQFLADRDLKVRDLADRTGLAVKTISVAINHDMTWHVASRIASALNVAPDAICDIKHPVDDDVEAVAR